MKEKGFFFFFKESVDLKSVYFVEIEIFLLKVL